MYSEAAVVAILSKNECSKYDAMCTCSLETHTSSTKHLSNWSKRALTQPLGGLYTSIGFKAPWLKQDLIGLSSQYM